MRIKPDIYDYCKESNLQDNTLNIEIKPLFGRTREYCKIQEEIIDIVNWEQRVQTFKFAFFTMIWQSYEKARKVSLNSNKQGHKAEEWDFEKTGNFHPKFSLNDESFLVRTLPEISNQYLDQLRLKGEEKLIE
jgi:hypothetical protein